MYLLINTCIYSRVVLWEEGERAHVGLIGGRVSAPEVGNFGVNEDWKMVGAIKAAVVGAWIDAFRCCNLLEERVF